MLGFAYANNMAVAMCYFIMTEGSLGQPWEQGTLAARPKNKKQIQKTCNKMEFSFAECYIFMK